MRRYPKIVYGGDITNHGTGDKDDLWNLLLYLPVSEVKAELTQHIRDALQTTANDYSIPHDAVVVFDVHGESPYEQALQCRLCFYGNVKSREKFKALQNALPLEMSHLNYFSYSKAVCPECGREYDNNYCLCGYYDGIESDIGLDFLGDGEGFMDITIRLCRHMWE